MPRKRASMTVQIVPLAESSSTDLSLGLTAAERIALVDTLSLEGWALTGRPMPSYDRATMPIRVVPLRRGPRESAS